MRTLAGFASLVIGLLATTNGQAQVPAFGPGQPPAATLGQPVGPAWDPYAAGGYPPATAPVTPGAPSLIQPPVVQPGIGQVPPGYANQAPALYPGSPPAPVYGQPYGQPYPPNQPPVLFPNGGYPPPAQEAFWPQPQQGPYMRFFQQVRLSYTWVNGGDGLDVDQQAIETSATAAFPNFLYRGEPLLVTPGFVFRFWDGPSGGAADLPPRAYDAYLDFDWKPQITPQFSGEVGFRIGVYSDFDTVTTESIRLQGRGFGVVQITPTMTAKLGVVYLDRLKIKLLPAGGLLWIPNEQTRWEIYFPNPRLAHYLTTVGTAELWWYLSGEYGTGSWTIDRAGTGASEQIDINDMRAIFGVEWIIPNRSRGFFEAGWVFQREVLYRDSPDDFDPGDNFMLRAGLIF